MIRLRGPALLARMLELLAKHGAHVVVKQRTLKTACPICGRSDKFSILKENGATVCFRGSCDFGRKWFEDYLSIVANLPRPEAAKLLHSTDYHLNTEEVLPSFPDFEGETVQRESVTQLPAIEWPPEDCVHLTGPAGQPGAQYLASRGIDIETATRYGILYSLKTRRIMLPVHQGDKIVGYQGRATNPNDKQRMLNSENGFRGSTVMFENNLKDRSYAVIAEGPFDAMKFDLVGGNVATMGKEVTYQQIQVVTSFNPKAIFLALDDDAISVMEGIAASTDIPCYMVRVPESCRQRCAIMNKKADFGECTFEECAEAWKNARLIDGTELVVSFG